jgi:hypothetical protein
MGRDKCRRNTKYTVYYVCNLVEEVDETCIHIDLQSENNDAEEGDSRRRAPDAQSDPEYETKDHDDDDSSGEDDDDDSQVHDVTLQPGRPSKRKSERYASTMDGKSPSLEPKRGTNTQKKSKTDVDDTEASARLVSCPICNKQFKGRCAKSNLKIHLDIHDPESKYPCPHCPARFKQEYSRQRHIKLIHLKVKPVIVKKFACQFCAKKFSTHYFKKVHEMVSNIATTDFVF